MGLTSVPVLRYQRSGYSWQTRQQISAQRPAA